MILGWEVWFGAAAIALGIAVLMANGIHRFRESQGAKWKSVVFCALSVFFSTGLSGLSFWQAQETVNLVRVLKNSAPPNYLSADWGASFGAEKRFEGSQMLARKTFVDWGIHVNYFDVNGVFRQYEPTDQDRWNRATMLRFIEGTALTGTLLFWAGLGWILIPWLGLTSAFMPRPKRAAGALTGRSNTDAPPAGGAPLS